jgi:putative hydrolase of the HAD superfamily
MIKAIIFDLGNVIVPFDFKRGYAAMEPVCCYPAAEIPKRIGATDLVRRFESGHVAPEEFVREISATLSMNVDYERFCEMFSTIFLPDTLIPESLLQGLRARYRLLLLSNTNAIHWPMLERTYPLLGQFHDRVLSFEVGRLKPEPEIFREAVSRAGCRPEECFFTDDVEAYVAGAKREGIDAVRFESQEQIEQELRKRGVDW